MNDNNDPRHDPEGAMLLIKAMYQRGGDAVAADDADDETREFVRMISATQAEERRAYAAQEAAKRAAGRYTLEEAAQALTDGAGERVEVMLGKLRSAAASGALPEPRA